MQRPTTLPSPQFKNRPSYWVLFFVLLGFALRVQRLDFQPLWGDEGWSFYLALQPLPDLLALTAIDIHPPLYYILLKGWLAVVGVGAEEARLHSVLFGTLLIPSLYLLGRRLFERWVGVAAAAVVALMPLAIYYSQEVRMYGLVTLLGVLSFYFFVKLLDGGGSIPSSPDRRAGAYRGVRVGPDSSRPPHPSIRLRKLRLLGMLSPKISDRPDTALEKSRRLTLIGYVLATTAALYTHYYAVLLLAVQGLYIILRMFQAKNRPTVRAVLTGFTPFIGVGLLYLPWVLYLGPRLSSYLENKRDVEGYLPLNPLRFFGDHFVAFSLGHLPADWRPYVLAALPFVVVAAAGFIAALYFNRRRSTLPLFLYLFGPLLLGYGINLIFPFNPPYFERTLLLVAPAYWLFIAAGLVSLGRGRPVWAGLTGLLLLFLLVVGLFGFYSEPRYPHSDYRPLLADIAAIATPEDTLLASYQWQLGFYAAYLPQPHPRLFTVPGWGQGWAGAAGRPQMQRDLAQIFETSPRLWFPAYQASGHIWEDQAEAAIAELGYPAWLKWYSPETKLTLAGQPQVSLSEGPTANFDDRLALTASRVGDAAYEAGRGIIPVTLTWRKMAHLGSEYRVSLRLADAAGRTWASRDSFPLAGQRFFTDLAIGDSLEDRHGLLLPAGLPPGRYRLLLSARRESDAQPLDLRDSQGQPQGAELLLNEVQVVDPARPLDPAALPVQVRLDATFDPAVRLIGYSLGHGPFKAGQALPLTLFWQALVDQSEALTVSIELQDEQSRPVVAYQNPPLRPATDWRTGMLLRDPQEVPLPPTLPPGEYQLTLALIGPDGRPLAVDGQTQVQLRTIETIDRPHNFEPPTPQIELEVSFGGQAKLVGADLPQTEVEPGGHLPLTLHWQAVQPFDRDWKVFVHLIDSRGDIISQQDQVPGAGQFPTTGWLPNEYLTDSYNLPIPADVAGGEESYQLRIGLYDANDGTRLPVMEADQIVGDHVMLENQQIFVR